MFAYPGDSHKHSLKTLSTLYEYSDFMESITTMVDLGCGTGEDLEWWATRTTNDDSAQPLDIQCHGIDLFESLPLAKKYPNISYTSADFEHALPKHQNKYDVLWCHDAFQYCINPIETLGKWWHMGKEGAMLILVVPQTTNLSNRQHRIHLTSGCYYHHTVVSLIHMMTVSGWDCRPGFFRKEKDAPWIGAIAYKSEHAPMDPKKTTWYDLVEKNLLPDTVAKSVKAHGHVLQQELVLPWVDQSLTWFGQH